MDRTKKVEIVVDVECCMMVWSQIEGWMDHFEIANIVSNALSVSLCPVGTHCSGTGNIYSENQLHSMVQQYCDFIVGGRLFPETD